MRKSTFLLSGEAMAALIYISEHHGSAQAAFNAAILNSVAEKKADSSQRDAKPLACDGRGLDGGNDI
jgi:hypothetical protein